MTTEPAPEHDPRSRAAHVIDEPPSPGSLVGSFFHSDAARAWQGVVVAEPRPGIYLVEREADVGGGFEQRLVTLDDMLATGWRFYDLTEQMTEAYEDRVQHSWERERTEEQGACRVTAPAASLAHALDLVGYFLEVDDGLDHDQVRALLDLADALDAAGYAVWPGDDRTWPTWRNRILDVMPGPTDAR